MLTLQLSALTSNVLLSLTIGLVQKVYPYLHNCVVDSSFLMWNVGDLYASWFEERIWEVNLPFRFMTDRA